MSIEALVHTLTPPAAPAEATGNWAAAEEALGTPLPDDFKDYISTYGSGVIGDFITVLNPFSARPTLNLIHQSEQQLSILRELHDTFGEPLPFPLHPSRPGLLPVAMTDNGDVIHWLTANNATDWTIVVNESRSPDYQRFQSSLTDFIRHVIEKSIVVRAFPKSIFLDDPKFRTV